MKVCGHVSLVRRLLHPRSLHLSMRPAPRLLCTAPPPKDPTNSPIENVPFQQSHPEKRSSQDLVRDEVILTKDEPVRHKVSTPPVSVRPLTFEDARDLAQQALGQKKQFFNQKLEDLRIIFGGKTDQPRTEEQEWYYKRVSFWMKRYENFVGLTEVKAAQARVVECEKKFIETQELRREAQKMITDVQKRIKEIHVELDKSHRGEDKYLQLVTQEHQVLKEEMNLQDEFKFYEKQEREYFSNLSNAVRDSHEKERAQAEKTKYWSIIGSIIGTCLGIIGTTINNRLRMNELRRLVSQNSSVEEIRAIGEDLSKNFSSHQTGLSKLVGEVQAVLTSAGSSVEHLDKMEELFGVLRESSDKINTRLLDETLAQLQSQQMVLAQEIEKHQDTLDKSIENIQNDMFVQSKNIGHLTHITLKDREKEAVEREKREADLHRHLDSLVRQGAALESALVSNTRDIEDKMKDVRSLLLMETQLPKFDHSVWSEKLERLEARQIKFIQEGFAAIDKKITMANKVRLDTLNAINSKINSQDQAEARPQPELQLVELDTIVHLMEEQQKKTVQTVVIYGLTLTILAPLAVYVLNQIL